MDRLSRVPFTLLFTAALLGQTSIGDAVEASRRSRAPKFDFDEAPYIERGAARIAEPGIIAPVTKGLHGFRLKMGSMVLTSGFALGPEFLTGSPRFERILFRTSARFSAPGYQLYDAEFALPSLAGDRLFFNALAAHRNYPRLPYFGPGPDSSANNRTSYRLENTSLDLTAGVRPFRHMRLGATSGVEMVNVGRGRDSRFRSTEQLFGPRSAPGVDHQSDFLTAGGFLEYDYTESEGTPRRGGNYSLRFTNYVDQTLGTGSFRRVDVDLRQYLPFFQKQRMIALRAYSVLTDTSSRKAVPFYLQPSLGGPEAMRGFHAFRFYDNNLLLLTAEYRWKVSSGVELAFFGDGGKVFPRRRDFNLRNLEGSYGAGVRFNIRREVFLRLDFGCSHEGCNLWLRFHDFF